MLPFPKIRGDPTGDALLCVKAQRGLVVGALSLGLLRAGTHGDRATEHVGAACTGLTLDQVMLEEIVKGRPDAVCIEKWKKCELRGTHARRFPQCHRGGMREG